MASQIFLILHSAQAAGSASISGIRKAKNKTANRLILALNWSNKNKKNKFLDGSVYAFRFGCYKLIILILYFIETHVRN